MKLFFRFLLVLLVGLCGFSFAQGYDLQFVVTQNDGSTFKVIVQIRGTGSSFRLGDASFYFTFNSAAMTYESLLFNPLNFSGSSYGTMNCTFTSPNYLAVNITINDGATGTTVSSSWMNIASITFTTLNSNSNANLAWDSGGSVATDDTPWPGTILLTQGSLSPLDTTLPVQLALFKAQSTASGVVLEWRTESEINNLGFNLYRSQSSNADFAKVNPNIIAGAGNSTQPLNYRYTDDRVQKTGTFYYRLESVDVNGKRESFPAVQVEVAKIVVPDQYYVNQNYPNPFNPTTSIKYGLPEASHVRVEIFNLRGEQVAVLQDGEQAAGTFELTWDGRNVNGQVVPTGVYLYRINAGSFTDSKKMIFAK